MSLPQEEMDKAREGGRRALSFVEGCRTDQEDSYDTFRLPPPYKIRTATGLYGKFLRGLYYVFGP